ncbi:protein crumbs-like [Microplitis mediator]|uniref:protein crumbs-like n=1 Tax=Microplitis mediator TaxID=375433 RepID=UPI0025548B9F|nr:protein crumbs-like [Microplitis mediator]
MDKCVCKKNYIRLNEKTCLPFLGEYCSTNGSCATENSNCIDNRCQCKSQFIPLSSNKCITAIREKFCHTNNDCSEIKNAECTEEKKCSCKLNHAIMNEMACEPLLGELCTTNRDCITANSVCNINKCQCNRYYVAKSKNQCEPFTLGKPCENNMECFQIPNAVCSLKKICDCDKNHYAMDDQTCLPILGGFCSQDDHCRYNTMNCVNNMCQCKSNFIAISGTQCKEKNLVPSCNEDFDCGDPWHGQCSEDEKCVCRENNIASNDWTCSPLIGGLCWTNRQCQVENSTCIDFHCECKSNFVSVSNHLCVEE